MHLLRLFVVTLFSLALPSFEASADEEVDALGYPTATWEELVSWDSEWLFWASEDTAPPCWPLTGSPESRSVLELQPEVPIRAQDELGLQSSAGVETDRVLILRTEDHGVSTEGDWWSGSLAPYSAFSERQWVINQDKWEQSRKRRLRKKQRQFSRTQLVFPSGQHPSDLAPAELTPPEEGEVREPIVEPGLTTLYFTRSFQVDDPEQFVALQVQSRFNKGLEVFINGTRVVMSRLNPEALEHGDFAIEPDVPDFIWMDVGYNDRWQNHWDAIPADSLKVGENHISVAVHKLETGEDPALYFDLHLRGWHDIGWMKMPYLHAVTQNEVTVSWETTVPSVGEVQILDADDQVITRFESSHPSPHHEVRITGLSPDTTYRYRIQAEVPNQAEGIEPLTLMSAVDPFTTAPLDDMAFNFLFYGDSRFGAGVHRSLVDLMVKDIDTHNTNVVMHAGDIVSTGYTWDLWHDRFFAPAWPLLSKVPIYPTTGNHEVNQKLYYDYFDLPGNESWYHVRYGIVDFYAINTNVDFSPESEQYAWLDKVMSEGEAPWKIALFHHPPFACANGRKSEGGDVREFLVPLLEKHGVDLALLGHDHVYGRSREINGVTYVISGGGGSPLYNSSTDANMVFCEKKYNYTRFHVGESSIRWVAIDETGDLIDEFTIFQ